MRADTDVTELKELLEELIKYLRRDRNHLAIMLDQQFHRSNMMHASWSCGNNDFNIRLEFYKKPHSKK